MSAETDPWGMSGGGEGHKLNEGDDHACRTCKEPGHFARDCPQSESKGLTGECYNCGEVGHNKADCPNPKVDRAFTGTCNLCNEAGHMARNCPTKPPVTCKNCRETGHFASECTSKRFIDWKGVPELTDMEAWEKLIKAAKGKDLDAFRVLLRSYARAIGENFKLSEIERSLREEKTPIYIIAVEQPIQKQYTIVDLLGNKDRKHVLIFQFSPDPRRFKKGRVWPADAEENLAHLDDAGFVEFSDVPYCVRCRELGHTLKGCTQERHVDQPKVMCVNCNEEGHRMRDCKQPRKDPFACRRCGKSGHKADECTEPRSAEGVECRRCGEMGHFSRDCPQEQAPKTCRNCGAEGHISRDCDQPKNPANVTCRNCDKLGHFSRDCPEPKDWSRVKCSNCGENGHTIKRCKKPVEAGEGDFGAGPDVGPVVAEGGWDDGSAAVAAGNWD